MGFKCGKFPELTGGGNISFLDNGYKIHTFTSSGSFTNSSSYNHYADILVVGGGGGSGYSGSTPRNIGSQGGTAGGGGAGSVLKRKWVSLSNNTSFPVIVGNAGNSDTGINQGPGSFDSTPGGDTIFNSPGNNGIPEFRAPGGARGAESIAWTPGARPGTIIDNPLGSGGGGSAAWGVRAQTGSGNGRNLSGFGFDGGDNGGSSNTNGGAGGGGGAGSTGIDGGPGASPSGGLGGEGLPISDFTGNPLDYAGVGGGGSPVSPSGPSFPTDIGTVMNSAPRHPQDINSPTHYGRGGSVGPNNNRQAQDGVVIVKLL